MTKTGQIKRAGVIGWPIDHSLSPILHGYWLNELGIDGTYEAFAVAPADATRFIADLASNGLRGINVTVPHKETALGAVDQADETARRIGAVNTIVVGDRGGLTGTNTDAYGFMQNLMAGAPAVGGAPWSPVAGPAVVLGAGGAARAVVAALVDSGVPEIRLLNRTRDRADALAADLGGPVAVVDWSRRDDALEGAHLLVNTTTLGMTGKPALELDLAALPAAALVNDIVYAPLETPLLAAAASKGNPCVDGLGMLLHQARPGFKAWFGQEPQVTPALRDHVLSHLRNR